MSKAAHEPPRARAGGRASGRSIRVNGVAPATVVSRLGDVSARPRDDVFSGSTRLRSTHRRRPNRSGRSRRSSTRGAPCRGGRSCPSIVRRRSAGWRAIGAPGPPVTSSPLMEGCPMPSSGEARPGLRERIAHALDGLQIECQLGLRRHRHALRQVLQPAAAVDHGREARRRRTVHTFTGCCPTVAVHVLWDFPRGVADTDEVAASDARREDRRDQPERVPGSGVQVRLGRQSRPRPSAARPAHCRDTWRSPGVVGSRDVSLWFADGTNYPGRANIAHRKRRFEEGLAAPHDGLPPSISDAGRVQAVRAGVLSHRHRRLGHGASVREGGRPAGQGAGRYRASLPGAEHRADRRVAAGRRACSAGSTSTIAATPTTI